MTKYADDITIGSLISRRKFPDIAALFSDDGPLCYRFASSLISLRDSGTTVCLRYRL